MNRPGLDPVEAGERLRAVRERIQNAARRAGRDPSGVLLVAVAKTRTPDEVVAMARAGQLHFGENRVQEAAVKIPQVAERWTGSPLSWRMIGHLQRNKARAALRVLDTVDSVDSRRLLETLAEEARLREKVLPVLLEWNCSGEASKRGFQPGEEAEVASWIPEYAQHVAVEGLMTVGPLSDDPEAARPAFRQLRELRDRMQERMGRPLPHLSMGMSGDLEVAVEEGSTMVRVGTALFGPRA